MSSRDARKSMTADYRPLRPAVTAARRTRRDTGLDAATVGACVSTDLDFPTSI
jgi:hypothetical protein